MHRNASVDKSTHAWTSWNFNACFVLVSGLRPVSFRPAALPAPKFQAARFQRKFAERIFASVQGGWARRSGATVSEDNKAQKQRSLCKPCVPLSTEGIIGKAENLTRDKSAHRNLWFRFAHFCRLRKSTLRVSSRIWFTILLKNPKKHLNWKLKYVKVETARANSYWN